MSITTLYKSSLSTNKRHYNAGYVTALEDLLDVIQQGVSEPGAGADGHSLTIGRIMDWIDARREAIRTREEEEDEEEQRENRNKSSASSSVAGPSIKQTPAPAVQTAHNSVNDARDKEREKRKAVVGGPPIQVRPNQVPRMYNSVIYGVSSFFFASIGFFIIDYAPFARRTRTTVSSALDSATVCFISSFTTSFISGNHPFFTTSRIEGYSSAFHRTPCKLYPAPEQISSQ